MVITKRGGNALSPGQLHALRARIALRMPKLRLQHAQRLYWIHTEASWETLCHQHLDRLLLTTETQVTGHHIWVGPRLGCTSPFASQVMAILRDCGLTQIHSIEQGIEYTFDPKDIKQLSPENKKALWDHLHDPMMESISDQLEHFQGLFEAQTPQPLVWVGLNEGHQTPKSRLMAWNQRLSLGLSEQAMDYLVSVFQQHPLSDLGLMMFAQINSEHCRHKSFNAQWTIDGQPQPHSLFDMIRNTHQQHPGGVLSAYTDNGAILSGQSTPVFGIDTSGRYQYTPLPAHMVIKVETHNHPTAIAPWPGAATGAGGEIRDEAAVGRGGQSLAGLVGFSVSDLNIPQLPQPWEHQVGKPTHVQSALEIILKAPLGAAAFNNAFGRPNICGYFRTYVHDGAGQWRGYHKPIMLAGGMGQIKPNNIRKLRAPVGAHLIVLGGPAMRIGLGGGSASSMVSGHGDAQRDFASVQRSNPLIQRCCQEVINRCTALADNPILAIHDVGAGGLSNALAELVHESQRGAYIALRDIPNADPSMSPLEIWCNEAQERYVLTMNAQDVPRFDAIAKAEQCPYAVVGYTTELPRLVLYDALFDNYPLDVPMSCLFDVHDQHHRTTHTLKPSTPPLNLDGITLKAAAERILQLPAVADKSFLITIGDRSVGGLVARDPMVGPWQVPVADVGVIASGFTGYIGQAMALGERAPLALIDAPSSARMAIGEALTNIAAASIASIENIKLSANWMAAIDQPGEDAALYEAVKTVGLELCPQLGISIPVGKDSLSMQMHWEDQGSHSVTAPVSLVASAFAPVTDVRDTLTPQLITDEGDTVLLCVHLGDPSDQPLGGTAFAQVYGQLGNHGADIKDPKQLKHFFQAIQTLNQQGRLLAYHDRSDGGLLVSICEMAFAGHVGVTIDIQDMVSCPNTPSYAQALFNEMLGAVLQIRAQDQAAVLSIFSEHHLSDQVFILGTLNTEDRIVVTNKNQVLLNERRQDWQKLWSKTSHALHRLRDNADCADQAYAQVGEPEARLAVQLTFSYTPTTFAKRPKIALLRAQGVNGHHEMAAAFHRAGFDPIDVRMEDVFTGPADILNTCVGLIACGGFSYGDALGSGRGWASRILYHPKLRAIFTQFFHREDTFTLGVCNGCQMLAHLKSLIPGAQHWPVFDHNISDQFEARLTNVTIPLSPSVLFQGMEGASLPIIVAHGEGRAVFTDPHDQDKAHMALQYADVHGKPTLTYPFNPNGSPQGIAGLTSDDGRATILMPHPERCFRTVQHSWHPKAWGEDSPWMRLFYNARTWIH